MRPQKFLRFSADSDLLNRAANRDRITLLCIDIRPEF